MLNHYWKNHYTAQVWLCSHKDLLLRDKSWLMICSIDFNIDINRLNFLVHMSKM